MTDLGHPLLVVVLHIPRALHHLDKLFNPPSGRLDSVEVRKGMEPVGDISHQTSLVGFRYVAHILDIQQRGDANLFVGQLEGQSSVSFVVILVELVKVDQVGPMDVQ